MESSPLFWPLSIIILIIIAIVSNWLANRPNIHVQFDNGFVKLIYKYDKGHVTFYLIDKKTKVVIDIACGSSQRDFLIYQAKHNTLIRIKNKNGYSYKWEKDSIWVKNTDKFKIIEVNNESY